MPKLLGRSCAHQITCTCSSHRVPPSSHRGAVLKHVKQVHVSAQTWMMRTIIIYATSLCRSDVFYHPLLLHGLYSLRLLSGCFVSLASKLRHHVAEMVLNRLETGCFYWKNKSLVLIRLRFRKHMLRTGQISVLQEVILFRYLYIMITGLRRFCKKERVQNDAFDAASVQVKPAQFMHEEQTRWRMFDGSIYKKLPASVPYRSSWDGILLLSSYWNFYLN